MFKNLMMLVALSVFVFGVSCNVGCGGPGEVIEGKASNANFVKNTGEVDKKGRKIPDGLGLVD